MLYNTASTKVHRVLFAIVLALAVGTGGLMSGLQSEIRTSSSVCLNEIFPKSCDSPFPDFVELYNVGADQDIYGWTIVINSTSYPLEGTIPSGGYVVVTGFDLPAPSQGACVRLLDASGSSIDQYCYRFPSCDLSFGRMPDGGSSWSDGLSPSPGESNAPVTETPILEPTATETPIPTPTPTASSAPTDMPTPAPTMTHTPTTAPSATNSPQPSRTATRTATPSLSLTPLPSATITRTPTTTTNQATATNTMAVVSSATATPSPTLSRTATPTLPASQARICLSEFLPAPRSVDWDGNGQADSRDEWIELYNASETDVDLGGWTLDDRAGQGSNPHVFAAGTMIASGGYAVFFLRDTGVALNNDGDEIRLLAPDGQLVDQVAYEHAQYDVSYSRTGTCTGAWVTDLVPSPGQANPVPTPSPTVTPSPRSPIYLPLAFRQAT